MEGGPLPRRQAKFAVQHAVCCFHQRSASNALVNRLLCPVLALVIHRWASAARRGAGHSYGGNATITSGVMRSLVLRPDRGACGDVMASASSAGYGPPGRPSGLMGSMLRPRRCNVLTDKGPRREFLFALPGSVADRAYHRSSRPSRRMQSGWGLPRDQAPLQACVSKFNAAGINDVVLGIHLVPKRQAVLAKLPQRCR